ncbi:hypothetical protein SKAU_G00149410 [Synaphobranchus kaupii]|uniref:Uncharacterized protein n=1 Tax=Synaphobranchus kaupii TaxID=118154 RepID=A0A9Q1J573_SYNKA|nr:hypothetical protein SKAU_G00149410 [Synaphobranchus kaupii]
MYQCAEICLPRKKRVPESFHSNTYRIFDEDVPERLDSCKVYKDHIFPNRSAEEVDHYKTHNNPQPHNVKFIRTNVRWLNAPISHIETNCTVAEQSQWWPNGSDQMVTPKAPYSRDSIQRSDFQAPQNSSTPCTRRGCNPQNSAASGIVPTLSPAEEQKVLQERISFIHQYNSRRLKDQPFQGKEGGAAFLRSEPPGRGGNGVTSPQLGLLPTPTPRPRRDRDRALSLTGMPPQTTPRQRLRMDGPQSDGPPAKHVSSDWASATAAPKRRNRVQSLNTCPAALPSLRHGGRSSLH